MQPILFCAVQVLVGESALKVGNDVVYMLDTDRESYCCRCNMLCFKFFRTHLGVCRGVGMNREALYVSHIGED